jgi:3-oxoacyl-[acyl-carrier protein] reductase
MNNHNHQAYRDSKKTVLVTGAASGIGKAVAIRFAEKGWNVICHYHSSKEKALELKKIIDHIGVRCHLLKADLLSKRQIISLHNKLEEFHINSLVNNAGTYTINKHFKELTIEDITNTFMVNIFAPIVLTVNIFMRMKERRFGRIVNISSIAAKYGGSSYSLHYGCSKRALEGLTKTLAREGATYNVLVNTVRPGVIDTEFHKKFPKDMKSRIEMIPVKRMGTADDVADMVYYLGSDMNKFITNEIVTVAGGE